MGLAATVEVPDIATQSAYVDLCIDVAAVGLSARDRACVFLEPSPLKRQNRVVTWRGVQADPAGLLAEELPAQKVALDAVERCLTLFDMEWRLELGNLLAQKVNTLELQKPFNLERYAVGPTAHAIEFPLNVFQRDRGLDRVIEEDDLGVFPLAPGEIAFAPRPSDLEISSGAKGATVIESESELCHQGWHLLTQVEVESDILHPQFVHVQIKPAGVLQERSSCCKSYRAPS